MAAGDDLVTLREQAAFVVRQSMLLDREKEVATLANTAGTYNGNTAAATAKWDQSTTTVMADIGKAIAAIRAKTSMDPNTIFIPDSVAVMMATQEPFKNMLWYSNADPKSANGLFGYLPQFGLKVVRLSATYDAAGLGGSATTITDVWTDNVIVAAINNSWFNRGTTFLSTFTHTMENGADVAIREYKDEITNTLWIEGTEWRDVKVIDGHAGYLITNTLT
jgi:thiazole synthase ThiGH ThiG subunit